MFKPENSQTIPPNPFIFQNSQKFWLFLVNCTVQNFTRMFFYFFLLLLFYFLDRKYGTLCQSLWETQKDIRDLAKENKFSLCEEKHLSGDKVEIYIHKLWGQTFKGGAEINEGASQISIKGAQIYKRRIDIQERGTDIWRGGWTDIHKRGWDRRWSQDCLLKGEIQCKPTTKWLI